YLQTNLTLRYGFVILPGKIVLARQTVVDEWRKRIEVQCAFSFVQAFVHPSSLHQKVRIPVVHSRIVGIQLDRTLEFTFRPSEVPVVVVQYMPHRGVGFCQGIVQLQSPDGGGLGLRHGLLWWKNFRSTYQREERKVVRQTG